MKLVVNTTYQQAAGVTVLERMLKRLAKENYEVVRNDWEHYLNYDGAIFMAPDSKVQKTKLENPHLIVGIFDPKVTHAWQVAEVKAADFLVVSSIEQREFFLQYNKSIFVYYMFPDIAEIKKEHVQKEKIIIGYHGNKQHLDAMKDVSDALDVLAQTYDIEFRAVYNIEKLGKWRTNVPKKCTVKHLQWSEEHVIEHLKDCDIGITPSVLPIPWKGKLFARPLRSFIPFCNFEGYNRKDYMLRFKPSNNPGRLYVFSQLSIPVVADFTPSTCQFIQDGYSGMIAGTAKGWERALEMLITNGSLRQTCSDNLKRFIHETFSPEATFKNFLLFLNRLYEYKQ